MKYIVTFFWSRFSWFDACYSSQMSKRCLLPPAAYFYRRREGKEVDSKQIWQKNRKDLFLRLSPLWSQHDSTRLYTSHVHVFDLPTQRLHQIHSVTNVYLRQTEPKKANDSIQASRRLIFAESDMIEWEKRKGMQHGPWLTWGSIGDWATYFITSQGLISRDEALSQNLIYVLCCHDLMM